MDEEHIKQRKKDATPDLSTSASVPPSSTTTTSIPNVIQTKEEYFEALRLWLQQVQLQQTAMAYFPYYLAANYQQSVGGSAFFLPPQFPAMFPDATTQMPNGANMPNIGVTTQQINVDQQPAQPHPIFVNNLFQQNRNNNNNNNNNNFVDNTRRNLEVIQQNGGYEYVIAPIWKRFVAETIDVLILFIIKLMAAFMIIDIFDVDFRIDLDFDSLKSSLEEDYTDFLSFSSDLLLVEIITKVLVCFYEAMWTAQGQTYIGGATPGKIVMGIRILYVEGVVPLGQPVAQPGINFNNSVQMRALLYPASNPGFRRALLRAIAKNMLMTLMFPMCFVLLFFRNNRTGYDVMTKTIVVEEHPSPVRRRL